MIGDYKALKLIASSNPHIRSNEDTRSLMLDVVIALCPALAWSIYRFGFRALIAAAGKAAHLAGALAASTVLPVIGIPIKSSTLDGLDALLSTVQMPSGIPVATVAIDGAQNAALLAAQIIAVGDPELTQKLMNLRKAAADKVLEKDRALQNR